eukprot:14629727-Ditylum_brightwellii.AAC.1
MSEQILDEMTEDSLALQEKKNIQEKSFSIQIDEAFVQLRDDTKLILVDIQGMNEATSKKLYSECININEMGLMLKLL